MALSDMALSDMAASKARASAITLRMAVSSGRRGSLLETPGQPRYILHQVGRCEADARPQRKRPMQDTIDIEVTPLSPACGAEISGVDLSKPLSEHEVAAIKDAWGKHLVLVFRGQKVSQDDQLRFASYFGDLGTRKKAPEALRARTEGVQQDNETALHIHEYNRAKQANSSGDISGIPHHAHPIFITHPDTGRKTLFVDRLMTTRIEGVSQEESDAILNQLRDRRAPRVHLRARLAARRFSDVG